MLKGRNTKFRPASFVWLTFVQTFFKFYKNDRIQKLKAWSYRLWKNYFFTLQIEGAKAFQGFITIFFIHIV